jgi:hypothetical protein
LKSSDLIPAIASIVAALIGAIATWAVMRRQFASKKLTYAFTVEPLVNVNDPDLVRDLTVHYKGELLPSPTFLYVEIANVGMTAIENARVVITLRDTTYLIPGYFLDPPAGYTFLWNIDRTDAEECTIRFDHINPKQVARVRLLMDEVPRSDPQFSCPMPNVILIEANKTKFGILARLFVEGLAAELVNRGTP